MSNKFKVGDIVAGKKGDKRYTITNGDMTRAVVTKVLSNGNIEIKVLEHSLCGFAVGNEYIVNPGHFELVHPVCNWKVVIIPDGNKTVGKLYENGKVVKEVSTVKSRDDEYSMNEAIKVITERLTAEKKEEPKPKLYDGKVVCVDLLGCNAANYTVGKVYQFVDGNIVTDCGEKMPEVVEIRTFDDWARWTTSKFIEVVE